MKSLRILAAVLLVLTVFVAVDLGVNLAAVNVAELQDGIGYNSVLQSGFGLLENFGINSHADFHSAFSVALWIAFFAFAANVALHSLSVWLGREKQAMSL